MTKNEARKIIDIVNTIYRGIIKPHEEEAWIMMLEDYKFDDIKAAIKIYRKKKKFKPTLSEIIDIADNLFTVYREDITDDMKIISVKYRTQGFAFVCMDRMEINEVIRFFKDYPTYEEAERMFKGFLIKKERKAEQYA